MRRQPPRGLARAFRPDSGQHEGDSLQPGIRSAFGSGGKVARSLANFQGRSAAIDVESPSSCQKGVGQVARPRPGRIEVPHSAPPGSPPGGGKVAPGEQVGSKMQQALSSPQLSPLPQKSLGPSVPVMHDITRFTSAPEDVNRSHGLPLQSNLIARQQSPYNDRELQGVGSPRQLSPRPLQQPPMSPQQQSLNPGRTVSQNGATAARSPGEIYHVQPGVGSPLQLSPRPQKSSGAPKVAFGRSAYTAPDQFSAMSTMSVVSEDSFPGRKFRPLDRSQSTGALSNRGMGSVPQKSYAWRNRILESRSQHSARHGELSLAESPRTGKSEKANWGKATGQSSTVPLNFDRGLGRTDRNESSIVGAGANVETPDMPCSAKATTENSKRMRDSSSTKLSMTAPLDARSPPDRSSPCEMSVPAGVTSPKCPQNQMAACWQQPGNMEASSIFGESCASASSSKRVNSKIYDSSLVKEGFDHDPKQATQGHEVEENFCKSVHGRHMRLGRQLSEPPRSREKMKKFVRRNLHHEDYTKDESLGGIVPCVSPDIVRQSETHSALPWDHRGPGEFKAQSDYTTKLAIQKEQAFRVEHHIDKNLKQSSSSLALSDSSPRRRNPVIGDLCEPESARTGRSGPGSDINPAAGMSTIDLARSGLSPAMQSEKPQSRGRGIEHLDSSVMTSILKNAVAKDADRIRNFRETYDRPFIELCSAFNNIRENHVKEAQRIRQEVSMSSSHNVASLLRHSPRSQSCSAEVRSARSNPKDPISAGSPSRGRSTPAQSPFNSLQMEDALRWVC